jgi:hypothetical protein
MDILSYDFNAKVDREDILKPSIWNQSLHEISNDNGVMAIDFAHPKKSDCQKYNIISSHSNIHKFICIFPDRETPHSDRQNSDS